MSDTMLSLPRVQDEKILSCFKEIATHFSNKRPTCSISAQGGINTYKENLLDDEYSKTTQGIISLDSTFIYYIDLSVSGSSIALHRGGYREPKSPFFDELRFTDSNNSQLNNDEKLWLLATISSQLQPFDPAKEISGAVTPEQRVLQALHQQTLARLEALNETLTKDTHKYREESDRKYVSKVEELEEKYKGKANNLEQDYSDKHKSLEKEEAELQELRKKLDDRSNTHARREIRRDILAEVKKRTEKFELTKETRKLRLPIAISMLVLIIFLGAFAIEASIDLFQQIGIGDNNIMYVLVVRQLGFSFGAVGSLIYFIRWLNRWFEQHAQAEFQLRQFQLDIERASWVVETSLEWNDVKGTTMPDKLMGSLTQNLFMDKTQSLEPVTHPADQLASALLGSASSVKLKAGDSEIDIDPKKLGKTKVEKPK